MNPLQHNASRRRGFTLMEMVTSCLILSLLMVALGYGLKLALVSTGSGAAYAVNSLDAVEVVERVTDDLNEALNFTEKTATAVTFTVPDRGTDGQPDTIRYQYWPAAGTFTIPGAGGLAGLLGGLLGGGNGSTTAGNGDILIPIPAYTLTKQINGGTPSILGRDVRTFNLNYLYRSMSPAPPPTTPDRLLWECDPGIGTSRDGVVDTAKWFAATFLPSSRLPVGTTSFSITRVAVCLRSEATQDGLVRVSVRPALASNLPAGSLLESSPLVSEVSLTNAYGWVEFPFTTLTNLSPGTKYSIVVQGAAGGSGNFAQVNWLQTAVGVPSNTWFTVTTASGSPWSAAATLNCLRFRIYGTTTP